MSHTPGPWCAKGKSVKRDLTHIGLGDNAGVHIAVATGGKTSGPFFVESDEEVEANARLIAAAPELLEALQRCKFDSLNMSFADLAFCRAAIAKATGERKEK